MNRIDSIRAIEKIWNAECKNGQLLYWNYNEECWAIKDDLKLLAKYKRAFEILKPFIKVYQWLGKDVYELDIEYVSRKISQEKYELLKELMKDE